MSHNIANYEHFAKLSDMMVYISDFTEKVEKKMNAVSDPQIDEDFREYVRRNNQMFQNEAKKAQNKVHLFESWEFLEYPGSSEGKFRNMSS